MGKERRGFGWWRSGGAGLAAAALLMTACASDLDYARLPRDSAPAGKIRRPADRADDLRRITLEAKDSVGKRPEEIATAKLSREAEIARQEQYGASRIEELREQNAAAEAEGRAGRSIR